MTSSNARLIEQIEPWWVSRGWNPATLRAKSEHQLMGIRISMYKDLAKHLNVPIVTATQKQPAAKLAIVKNDNVRQNQYRQITLLDM